MNDIRDKYHSNEPWSYGSLSRVAKHNRQLPKKDVKELLNNNEIYSRFKHHKTSSKYSPIFVYTKRELFQADVVFFYGQGYDKSKFRLQVLVYLY